MKAITRSQWWIFNFLHLVNNAEDADESCPSSLGNAGLILNMTVGYNEIGEAASVKCLWLAT